MIDPVGERRPPISPQLAWRVAVLGGIALLLFAIVFFRLWYLQVLSGDQYLAEANDNQVRQERIQAPRGDIVDRNGETIVTNRRAIVVEISPAGLPAAEREAAATWGQKMSQRALRPDGFKGEPVKIPDIPTQELRERLRRLAAVLDDTTATEIQRRIVQSLAQVPYAPIRVETDVPRSVMNYVQERQTLFPNVTVEQVYLRQYPRTTLAAQMLGTVGEIQLKQLGWKHFRGVKQGTVVGQGGLEYQYDRYLRGTDGSREIQVDALGNPKGELREVAPKAGQRLKLSLDLALQREGQDALTGQGNPGGQPAAFVAMNPENGEILGMGSYPSFDPNLLTKPITQERYDQLFGEQAGSPLFNRATNGLYSTGSTFKVATALAALRERHDLALDAHRRQRLRGDRRPQVLQRQERAQRLGRHAAGHQGLLGRLLLPPGPEPRRQEGAGAPEVRPRARLRPRHRHRPPLGGRRRRPRPRVAQAGRRGGAQVPQEAQGRELRHLRHAWLEHR